MIVGLAVANKPRERIIFSAFAEGLRGDDTVVFTNNETVPNCDVLCMFGVKSKRLFYECLEKEVVPIMVDKGYTRRPQKGSKFCEYSRVAVGAHHPTDYITMAEHSTDRLEKLGVELKPWKTGPYILLAGSSAKYHDFYNMKSPLAWAKGVVKEIKIHSTRPIVYRPKPSWKEAQPIKGTIWSKPSDKLWLDLERAGAVITHGSNICFEAIIAGVPCIILGEGIAKPISSCKIENLNDLWHAPDEQRIQWLSNLAYCQWTNKEFASGEAWETIRGQVYEN